MKLKKNKSRVSLFIEPNQSDIKKAKLLKKPNPILLEALPSAQWKYAILLRLFVDSALPILNDTAPPV